VPIAKRSNLSAERYITVTKPREHWSFFLGLPEVDRTSLKLTSARP
jgi:hypothetical protein